MKNANSRESVTLVSKYGTRTAMARVSIDREGLRPVLLTRRQAREAARRARLIVGDWWDHAVDSDGVEWAVYTRI